MESTSLDLKLFFNRPKYPLTEHHVCLTPINDNETLRVVRTKKTVLVGAVLLSIGQDIARKGIPAWKSDGNVEASVIGCNGAKKSLRNNRNNSSTNGIATHARFTFFLVAVYRSIYVGINGSIQGFV